MRASHIEKFLMYEIQKVQYSWGSSMILLIIEFTENTIVVISGTLSLYIYIIFSRAINYNSIKTELEDEFN